MLIRKAFVYGMVVGKFKLLCDTNMGALASHLHGVRGLGLWRIYNFNLIS